ncbi:hypothetical protein SAMN05421507_10517 [Lentzea jiangxiensis]|uniref:Uncharacterized protein n=1 Tax=Lentzea jiangxiensis TaxID=641025 RepID=A0A1H0PDX3_9PSEU|nr:hypothetical protein SAMN05421507_10517 [Lentzea jiangxiensis]
MVTFAVDDVTPLLQALLDHEDVARLETKRLSELDG